MLNRRLHELDGRTQMSVLDALRRTFGMRHGPRRDPWASRKIVRAIVGRFAEGNVSLQAGQYITESDVSKVKKDLLKHDFRNPRRKRAA